MVFSTDDVLSCTRGRLIAGPGTAWYSSVGCDSRTAPSGSLFFALKGAHADGHQFVADAIARGAAGAVVAHPPSGPLHQADIIACEDPLIALGALATWCLNKANVARVAVTGSAGKTTTKEMTARVLAARHQVLSTPENYNTEIGVPLTACSISPDRDVFVAEMAMRGAGQIGYLSRVVRPQVAVITNVGRSHISLLGSRDAIRQAKLEICEGLDGGTLWLPVEDPALVASARERNVTVRTFGFLKAADVRATQVRIQPDGATRFRVTVGDARSAATLRLLGRHFVANALAAIGVGDSLGVPLEDACAALAEIAPAPHRGELLPGPNQSMILDDTYNANPEAVLAALRSAADWPAAGRRLVLFGDMLELGPAAEESHREVGAAAARLGFDWLGALGEFAPLVVAGAAQAGLTHTAAFRTKEEAVSFLQSALRPGDLLLIKGSRATQMEVVTVALATR